MENQELLELNLEDLNEIAGGVQEGGFHTTNPVINNDRPV